MVGKWFEDLLKSLPLIQEEFQMVLALNLP